MNRERGDAHRTTLEDDMGPIQVIGSGATINDATQTALDRVGDLLDDRGIVHLVREQYDL
ncbi:acetamidase/formamidase [Halovivax asiaticus JCM 14624]|uniref:Acetamidase/formamidase n=1 Tax=Halovivax asiaticus JCM 14624 TaxID=1227490 RepID=M0BBI3_9EURY|nr:acetamidase/formamidase [Halovivax asiaticus JCM 14624]